MHGVGQLGDAQNLIFLSSGAVHLQKETASER